MAHDRRRRGSWVQNEEDGCRFTAADDGDDSNSSASGGIVSDITSSCLRHLPSVEICHECDDCKDEACVSSKSGCDEFLSELYSGGCEQIEEEEGDPLWLLWWILGLLAICLGVIYLGRVASRRGCDKGGKSDGGDLEQYKQARSELRPANEANLSQLTLQGTYTERGTTQGTSYQLSFYPDGTFGGTATDDDGSAKIDGKLQWRRLSPKGKIAWSEKGKQHVEARGEISSDPHGRILVRANYSSNLNVSGRIEVASAPGATPAASATDRFSKESAAKGEEEQEEEEGTGPATVTTTV